MVIKHVIFFAEQWGEFAVSSIRLTIEPDHPDVVILSRTNGRRLYDEVQIQANGK